MTAIAKKSVRAGKFVGTAHADSVIKNYKQNRWVHNSKRLGKEDSLSVWFSMEDLELFLEKAKEHGATGVRYYFGAYDEQYSEVPLYAGRQTIVMVATKPKETPTGISDKDIYVTSENGTDVLGFNVGRLCPPMCTTDDGLGIGILDKGEEGFVIG